MSDDDYISGFLKEHDRDRYLASLILPGAKRADVQALYAFAADVAAIPARVSEPGPGEIRLQWWRDTLEGQEHGAVDGNPLAAALRGVLEKYNLPATPLIRLVAARRFDLYQDPMPDVATFEGYAGETVSTLYQYAAMILGDGAEPASGDAAGHLGVAHALIGHMLAFRYNAARARIFLPWSVFAANGITEQQVFAGQSSPELDATFGQLRAMAGDHLQQAQQAISASSREIRAAFAPIVFLKSRLSQMDAYPVQTEGAKHNAQWQDIARLVFWSLKNA